MMKRVLLAALLIAASVCAGWYAHSAREKVKMRNLKATDPELAALWEILSVTMSGRTAAWMQKPGI